MLSGSLFAVRHNVKQDGTGGYSTIQAAINAAVNGDSVIVYPGRYYENIDYSGKSITVASLEAITGNPAYRDSTIIDGNRSGACVKTSGNSTIYGFTIQNGSGNSTGEQNYGGGLFINNSQFKLFNCIIKNNRAYGGGGVFVANSTVQFKGTEIYNNYANGGGGIFFVNYANAVFDSGQRCSVYANYAGQGCDILGVDTWTAIHILLDMATLSYADDYYLLFKKNSSTQPGYFTYNILRGYRQEVNHDLYVSPLGDDNNSGFTPDEPLKTITWALHKIAPDSLNPKTVYVASGIYDSGMGQIYPLAMKSHARLIGDEINRPVLINSTFFGNIHCVYRRNAIISNFNLQGTENLKVGIMGVPYCVTAQLSNIDVIDVTNTIMGITLSESRSLTLRNIRLNNVTAPNNSPGFYGTVYSARIENCSFNNCYSYGGQIINISARDSLYVSDVSLTNCTVNGIKTLIQIVNQETSTPTIYINNLLVANSSTQFVAAVVLDSKHTTSYLSNCTFANNSAASDALSITGKWNISNCIFSNFTPVEIGIPMTVTFQTIINFTNNLIKNFPLSVVISPPNIVTFVQDNLDANPGFTGTDWTDPLSYRLRHDSPCIDAGTRDITGLNLPAYDLYGNLRVYNGIIDIGCHEWDGTVNLENNSAPVYSDVSLAVYPNPFRSDTNIDYVLPNKGTACIEIYNIKGHRIKSLDNGEKAAGQHTISWDGKDSFGKPCASGVYFCKMQYNNKSISKKLILMK